MDWTRPRLEWLLVFIPVSLVSDATGVGVGVAVGAAGGSGPKGLSWAPAGAARARTRSVERRAIRRVMGADATHPQA